VTTALTIIDQAGRVLAAQFGEAATGADDETPAVELLPAPGQYVVQVDLPDEVEQLSGDELTRLFAHVKVSWSPTVDIPRIEVRRHDSSGS
jgi:hypothetical protein